MDNIKAVLDQMDDSVLTEESKTAIVEAFTTAVDAQVESKIEEQLQEKVKLEVETAVKQLDEDHAEKLEKLLEAVDNDHTKKLEQVLEKVDADRAEKLRNVIQKYERMLKEEAITFRDTMVGEISNYLELYIDKAVPTQQIAEATENTQSKKILDEVKKIVSVDQDYIDDNIREALEDGKQIMENQQKELNEAIKENIKISQELKNTKAELILEKKTINLPEKKKDYIVKVLNEKSPEYIEENFEYVVEMFERDENDEVEILTEEAKSVAESRAVAVPESQVKDEVISESTDSEQDGVDGYLSVMKDQDYKRK